MPVAVDAVEPAVPNVIADGRGPIRSLTIGAVALISLTAFEAMAVATVMPPVAADLDGLALYALAFGAPLATSVVGMAVAGAWSDATGAARPLLVGLVLFCAGLLMAGLAPLMGVFVLGRSVQGLGSGMTTVALYVLVGAVVPEPDRPRMFAWFSAAWVVPAMVGPAIAGLLLHTAGWRVVFLLVPALALPAGALLVPALGLPSGRRRPQDAGQVRSRVLLAVGAGGSAAVLQVAGAHEQWWWRVVAVLALVAMTLCALRLLPAGTFRMRRGLPAVVVLRGAVAAAFFGTEAFLPLLLVRERGWAPEWAGVVLTVSALSWSASAWFLGKVTDSRIRWRVAVRGTGLLLVGVLSVLVTAVPATPTAVAVLGWALSGAGMGVVYSGTSLLALQLTPPEKHGEATSSLTTGEALATAGVLALAGGLFAALLPIGVAASDPAGPGPYLVAVAVALIAASTAVVAVWRTEPR